MSFYLVLSRTKETADLHHTDIDWATDNGLDDYCNSHLTKEPPYAQFLGKGDRVLLEDILGINFSSSKKYFWFPSEVEALGRRLNVLSKYLDSACKEYAQKLSDIFTGMGKRGIGFQISD